jgi:Fic family protein
MQYQRSIHLENALRLMGPIDEKNSSSMRAAKRSAEEIVEGLLFCNEAKIEGDGIEGDKAFEEAFAAQAKLSKSGKHLRKFRLYGRLFKYRCSYMIHSEAFLALPEVIQKLTFQRIHEILTAETPPEGYEHLKTKEKKTILEILLDTTAMNDYLKK